MQIHELNSFSGTPGNNNYLAIDDGSDTGKISGTKLLAPVNNRIDNIISGVTSDSEVVDGRLGADGVTYGSLGTAIRTQVSDLKSELLNVSTNIVFNNVINSGVTHGEYWSTTDGSIGTSSSWCRSSGKIAVDEAAVYVSELSQNVQVLCFDADDSLLDVVTARPSGGNIYTITPPNTRFVAFNTSNSASISAISVRKINNVSVIEYPFTGDDIVYADGYVYGLSGVVSASSEWGTALIAGLNGGERYYVNALYSTNFVCFDENSQVISGGASYEEVDYYGRIYSIPSNAKYCWVNIQKNKQHGDVNSVVCYKIDKSSKILAIGDSLTWLDGRSGYDGATLFLGWQKQLERAGYEVVSAGYSGYSYATGTQYGSIYTEIVTNGFDVSGYDYIILFGGTNDDLYSVPLGDRCTDYSQTSFDASTFNGALCGIIRYIRENNPSCKIVLCSIIKSEASARTFTEAVTYVDAIEYNSKFWGCYYNNLFANFNVSPFTDGFDEYYYDNTHPNKEGMRRIGELMVKAVENA